MSARTLAALVAVSAAVAAAGAAQAQADAGFQSFTAGNGRVLCNLVGREAPPGAEAARLLASQDRGERLADPGRRTTAGPRARWRCAASPSLPRRSTRASAGPSATRVHGCSCAPARRRESPATTSTATASCSTRTASPPTERGARRAQTRELPRSSCRRVASTTGSPSPAVRASEIRPVAWAIRLASVRLDTCSLR